MLERRRQRGGRHGHVLALRLLAPQPLVAQQQLHDLLRQAQRRYALLRELHRQVRLELVLVLQTLHRLGAAVGRDRLRLVEELAALRLSLGEGAGVDLEVLHLATHLEALEDVPGRREVELLLFGLDVFVLLRRFRFLRWCDA